MAKKKPTQRKTSAKNSAAKKVLKGDEVVSADLFMKSWAEDLRETYQTNSVYVGDQGERLVIGIPLFSLAQRLIFQTDHLPLGRTLHIYGPTESLKSAFCFDLMRLIVTTRGGFCNYGLTETNRDQAVLRNSTVGYRFGKRIFVNKCRSVEEWQDYSTAVIRKLRDTCATLGGYGYPIGHFTDSAIGSGSQAVVDSILEKGHAEPDFAREANLIKIYLQALPGLISDWPILWAITNHMKTSVNRQGIPEKRTGGGQSIGFHTTFGIEMRRTKDLIYSDGTRGREVSVTTTKNSLGDGRVKLLVNVMWWSEPDRTQTTVWDWHSASIDYLDKLYDIDSGKDTWKKKIQAITDLEIHSSSKRATSKTLGVKNVIYSEASEALEANLEVKHELDKLFGIHFGRTFLPGVPFDKQVSMAINNRPLTRFLPEGPSSIFEREDPEAEVAARAEAAAKIAEKEPEAPLEEAVDGTEPEPQ